VRPCGNSLEELHTLPYNQAKSILVSRFSEGYLRNLLVRNHGNVTNAAADCGLERQALQRIMRRYGIISIDFKQK